MKRFALIGAAGYIAPRHMKAIKETGNKLVAAFDPNDSVGILDSYFPDCKFFTEFERFDRYIDKIRRENEPIDYFSVCSPNYLHDAHCRFGLRSGADVICEKPLVLNPWNLDALQKMEEETGKSIFNILQLRYHDTILSLKDQVKKKNRDHIFEVEIEYITSRGPWYQISWKGDISKSGGIPTNIGVHFFDMLIWIFGDVLDLKVKKHLSKKASGQLQLKNARVKWFLSIDKEDLSEINNGNSSTYRNMTVDNVSIDFTSGFEELHTKCYHEILMGRGYGIEEVRKTIALVHDIRARA